ncbi:transglutaminase domain-containing protein [Acidovorax sp. YS12]|nr:transglutaminase domain-containing protein [Acidovorax sp. YS12]
MATNPLPACSTEGGRPEATVLRGLKAIVRPVARVVVLAHLALALQPLSALAHDGAPPGFNPAATQQMQRLQQWNAKMQAARHERQQSALGASAELAQLTALASSQASDLLAQQGMPGLQAKSASAAPPLYDSQTTAAQLHATLRQIATANAAVRAEFAPARQALEAKGVPTQILARHDQAVARFDTRVAAFDEIATRILPGASAFTKASALPLPADLQALQDLLHVDQPARKASATPARLPWRTPDPTTRAPAASAAAWAEAVATPVALAARAKSSIAGLAFDVDPPADEAPTADDLAATDEAVLSPAIRAKAQELEHNPLAIQNWVRNHIEWMPTWGAVQNADTVLASGRGNAFDIASLTIALLRASGIPARYQFGTIQLPASAVRNWTGGFTQTPAAQAFMGQGGIANQGLTSAGTITHVRMEHVWVRAYVHYAASRGAVNASDTRHTSPNALHNAWVPLDASYKQYTYSQGIDLQAQVPLDAQALLDAARQGASVNEAEGWVQNLDQSAVQAQLDQYQRRLKQYIDSQNPNATVGQVIGKKIVTERLPQTLSGHLPYEVVAEGALHTRIPAQLQHRFSYSLSNSWGDGLLTYSAKTSELVGKRLTLHYAPADQATADLIASYLPKPHADGSPIQPSELPTSLPGYLIRLKPQLTLDGQTVAQGTSDIGMGEELQGLGGFTQYYNPSQWDYTTDDSHIAGQATAIGISAGGINARQLADLKTRLEATKSQLQANNVQSLTGEQISGDLLTAVIWSWFAAAESHNRLSQNQAGIVENPGLSYGLFHAVARPAYSWGMVFKVTFPGVNLDIGHVRNITWAKDNDRQTWIGYNKLRGQYMSALEHAVPERFFNDPNQCNDYATPNPIAGLPDCPRGISAMSALGIAAAQGQKIFVITPKIYANNPNIVNSVLNAHSLDTKQRVQEALHFGYEVTIHERPILESGWKGAGYTKIDPTTGAGGYMIDGGSNGAALILMVTLISFLIIPLAMLVAGATITSIATAGAFLIIAIKQFIEKVDEILKKENLTEYQKNGAIGLLSALTLLTNVFAIFKAGSTAAVVASLFLLNVMLSVFKTALDWIIALYENLPEYKKNNS